MKILDLHVRDFGKLHDFTLIPEPGMNLIVGENEYGKSTLLAFIRAMFYGFPKSAAKMRDLDRRKYMPWDKTSFGGSIRFEFSGETYLLERVFRKRKADDTAELRALPSGRQIDLSQKEPGEYLLGVTDDEFVNTVFVGQLSSVLRNTGKDTDDLSARLSGLSGGGREEYSYDEVLSRLTAASAKLKALRGQGGLIPNLRERLDSAREQYAEAIATREEIDRINERIRQIEKAEKSQSERVAAADVQLAALNQANTNLTEELHSLEISLQKKRAILELRKRKVEEEARAKAAYEERKAQTSSLLLALDEEEMKIKDDLEGIRASSAKATAEAEERGRLAATKIHALRASVRDAEALLQSQRRDCENREKEFLASGSEVKGLLGERDLLSRFYIHLFGKMTPCLRYMILFFCVGLIAVAAFLFLREPVNLIGAVFFLPAIGLYILNRMQLSKLTKRIVEANSDYESRIAVYENVRATCGESESILSRETADLQAAEREEESLAESAARDRALRRQLTDAALERMKSCASQKKAIVDSQTEDDKRFAAVFSGGTILEEEPGQEAEPGLKAETVEEDSSTPPISMEESLSEIAKKKTETEELKAEITKLSALRETLSAEREKMRIEKASTVSNRESLLLRMPDLSRIEEEEKRIQERLEEAESRYRGLDSARKILADAYAEMENYFAPQVNERAGVYLSKLTSGKYRSLHVDRSFDMELAAEGEYTYRSADFFSGGTIDQAYLSLRLAVSDLVHPKENRLPLFLDDALTQYDDDRAKAALLLLDEIAADRQILFFSCQRRMKELYATR